MMITDPQMHENHPQKAEEHPKKGQIWPKMEKCDFLRIPSLPDFAIFCGDSGHKYLNFGTNASSGQFSFDLHPF